MNFLEELKERGLIFNLSDEEKFLFALQNKKKVYLGIDPTAPSLHLGNYLGITLLKRFIKAGYQVIVLLGGMTAKIGDPSFRTNERISLNNEKIKENLNSIEKEIRNLLPEAQIINNETFYENLSILDFINDICSFVNVSNLLDKEFLKDRLSKGIKLSEFTYPLFQSWDFLMLYSKNDVAIQIGGSDQWGNITVGIDLIRKKRGSEHIATGLTFPLLLDSSGKKFGKSQNNALFLNEKLTSPYLVYQYLLNLDDLLVPNLLRKFTFLNLEKIKELKNTMEMKKVLSFEICKDIYGIEIAKKMENISLKLFSGELKEDDFSLIKYAIPTIECRNSISFSKALKELGFVNSNSEINRLISSKGLFVFDQLVFDSDLILKSENSKKGYFLLRKGRKSYGLVHFLCWK